MLYLRSPWPQEPVLSHREIELLNRHPPDDQLANRQFGLFRFCEQGRCERTAARAHRGL